jgi:thiamine kinase-like enzyme
VSEIDGGLSSTVLKLTTTVGHFAYRAPSSLQATGGNAATDLAIARVAGRLGLGPEIVFSTQGGNETIGKWLDGEQTTSRDFQKMPDLISQAIKVLDRLHAASVHVDRFSVTALIDKYADNSDLRSAGIRAIDVARLRRRSKRLEQTIAVAAVCHNDPMPKNWLRSCRRLWLLDYEFGGIFDPAWDLATLANESGCCDAVLAGLHSQHPRRDNSQRVRAWMPIVDGLWALYAVKMSTQPQLRREVLLRVARKRWCRYSAS